MKFFKLRPGDGERELHIDVENFEQATLGGEPWCRLEGGKTRYYAVCPKCDNPVRICALYSAEKRDDGGDGQKRSTAPYGSHAGGDVREIAEWDLVAYYNCEWADPKKRPADAKRPEGDPKGNAVYEAMRDGADRVLYFWNQKMPFRINPPQMEKLIDVFASNESWREYDISAENLYALFPRSQGARPATDHLVRRGSKFAKAIGALEGVELEPVKATWKGCEEWLRIRAVGRFADLSWSVLNYRRRVDDDGGIHETVRVVLHESGDDALNAPEVICQQRFEVDREGFARLMASKREGFRNRAILDYARSRMP